MDAECMYNVRHAYSYCLDDPFQLKKSPWLSCNMKCIYLLYSCFLSYIHAGLNCYVCNPMLKSAGGHDGGGFPHVHVHAVTIYVQEECSN